jgi:hypothetical protein
MATPPRTGRSLSSKPLRVQVRSCKYLHITKRRRRAFKVVGLTWIVERTFAWLSQKSSLEQRLRVEGPNFGNLHRPGGHPPHAQTARPEVKLLKHPLTKL